MGDEDERLARIEREHTKHQKAIAMLSLAVPQLKETLIRMEQTQAEVSTTLKTISDSIIHQQYIRKELDEVKTTIGKWNEVGTSREQSLDNRVEVIEKLIRFVNLKILGAVLAAALALILK